MACLASLTFFLAPKSPSISSYPSSISLKFQSLKHSLATGPLHRLPLPLHFSLLYLNLNLIIQVSDQGSFPQGSRLDHLKKVKSLYDRHIAPNGTPAPQPSTFAASLQS